jgi:hypothetical protein
MYKDPINTDRGPISTYRAPIGNDMAGYLKAIWVQSGGVSLASLALSPVWPVWQIAVWPIWQRRAGEPNLLYLPVWQRAQSGLLLELNQKRVSCSVWYVCQSGQSGNSLNRGRLIQSGEGRSLVIWRNSQSGMQSGEIFTLAKAIKFEVLQSGDIANLATHRACPQEVPLSKGLPSIEASFEGACLRTVTLSRVLAFEGCLFRGAAFEGCLFRGAAFEGCLFRGGCQGMHRSKRRPFLNCSFSRYNITIR